MDELKLLINGLRNHPNLYLGEPNGYISYQYFLDGYLFATGRRNQTNYALEISRFMNKLENNIDSSNVPWSRTFNNKYAHKEDNEKIEILLNLLERYIEEKENGTFV